MAPSREINLKWYSPKVPGIALHVLRKFKEYWVRSQDVGIFPWSFRSSVNWDLGGQGDSRSSKELLCMFWRDEVLTAF